MNSFLFGRKQVSPICNVEEGDSSSLRLKLNDGVSPMTYKKLKELGYTSDDWQNWSDDEKFEKSQKEVAKSKQSQQHQLTPSTYTYNKYANTKDARYLKEALAEMRRYERNWSGMKASEKRNIAPGGISELREDIRNAEAQLKKVQNSAQTPDQKSQDAVLSHFGYDATELSAEDKQRVAEQLSYKSVYSPKAGVIDFEFDGSDYDQAAAALMKANKTKGTAKILRKPANTQLVKMTPEEYMTMCIDILGNATEADLNNEYVKSRAEMLGEQINKRKKISPMYLDLRKDMLTQEGRHRMLALKQAGVKEVPVLVLTDPDSSESLARENGSLKYNGFRRGYGNKREAISSNIKGVDLSEYAQK